MNGKELHSICCEAIANFDDAELFCIDEDIFQSYSVEDIEEMAQKGYLSFDDKKGHEAYYTNI